MWAYVIMLQGAKSCAMVGEGPSILTGLLHFLMQNIEPLGLVISDRHALAFYTSNLKLPCLSV